MLFLACVRYIKCWDMEVESVVLETWGSTSTWSYSHFTNGGKLRGGGIDSCHRQKSFRIFRSFSPLLPFSPWLGYFLFDLDLDLYQCLTGWCVAGKAFSSRCSRFCGGAQTQVYWVDIGAKSDSVLSRHDTWGLEPAAGKFYVRGLRIGGNRCLRTSN